MTNVLLPEATRASASFSDLGLPEHLVAALAATGIDRPFDIQTRTIPDAVAGRDVLGRGRTGSGKTLAFVLPMLGRLAAGRGQKGVPRGLILVPTRELANQVRDVIAPLARALRLRYATVYGGVAHKGQITAIRDGADIVIACPGRLLDLMEQRQVRLDAIEVTVIDEADHMVELGFIRDVRSILDATPRRCQRLLFSATLDGGVGSIVDEYLDRPVVHEVDEEHSPVVDMEHHVLHVVQNDRFDVIADLCAAPGRTLVFTRTKHGAKRLTEKLIAAGVAAVELHGNLSQGARTRNLASYSSGKVRTLVATDIAARGIHVDDIGLVIHADPPAEHKAFLHRSGRTARAGASGTVVTLMTDDQRRHVRQLARQAGIDPTISRVAPGAPLLTEIAPGDRIYDREAARAVETREARPDHANHAARNRRPHARRTSRGPRNPRRER